MSEPMKKPWMMGRLVFRPRARANPQQETPEEHARRTFGPGRFTPRHYRTLRKKGVIR